MSTPLVTNSAYNLNLPVKHLIKRAPVFVEPSASVATAASMMQQAGIGSVLVSGDAPGIITDRDLRGRVLAARLGPDTLVSQVMSRPVKTIDSEAPIFAALQIMLENNIHHLPVVDAATIIGVVSGTDLLRHEINNPLYLRRTLDQLQEPSALGSYANEIAALVEKFFNGGVSASEIGRIVSSLNDALVRRLVHLGERCLGAPPAAFAWLVFGSEGRLEQALLTDQDNALVYEEESAAARAYFEALANYIVQTLIEVGFPRCAGGYMATRWCKPLTEWRALFARYIRSPEPQSLLDGAIFFDFRGVAGDLSLEPLEKTLAAARNEKLFLSHMIRAALQFRPPLGLFKRVRTDNRKVDLKKGGIGPIVALARAAALCAGSHERSTLARLQAAGSSAALLNDETARTLADIYSFLLHLRLRRQLTARRHGEPLDHQINLAELSTLERRHLREAFVMIKVIQDDIHKAWRLDLLA
jgi:CBS domain-containing protein